MRFFDKLTLFVLNLATPKKSIPKFKDKKFFFILSPGRTGTKFFAEYLNSHPDVYAVHEPKPSWRLRMWSSAFMQGDVSRNKMIDVMRGMRYKSLSNIDKKIYIESNPFITGFASLLNVVFEDPTIIHIVRDPRDYIQSSLNHGTSIGLKNIANRYLPYWYTRTKPKTNDRKFMFRIAEFWTFINNYIEKNASGNYYQIKFEDIFKDDRSLQKINKIIGLKPLNNKKINSKTKVNQSQHQVINSWKDWAPEDCYEVNKICSPLMQKYGYGQEKEWLNKLKKSKWLSH